MLPGDYDWAFPVNVDVADEAALNHLITTSAIITTPSRPLRNTRESLAIAWFVTFVGSQRVRHRYNYHTVNNYIQALTYGVKYIYRTMPRLLTIWLDLGENALLLKKYVSV